MISRRSGAYSSGSVSASVPIVRITLPDVVSEDDKRVTVAGGRVTVTINDINSPVELKARGKTFEAQGTFAVERATTAVAVVSLPGSEPDTLFFSLK